MAARLHKGRARRMARRLPLRAPCWLRMELQKTEALRRL